MDTAFAERLIALFIVGPLFLLISHILYAQLTYKTEIPSNLPWVGKNSSKLFAERRAAIQSFANTRKWLAEGYEKVYFKVVLPWLC